MDMKKHIKCCMFCYMVQGRLVKNQSRIKREINIFCYKN